MTGAHGIARPLTRTVAIERGLDVGLALSPHRRGTGDPAWRRTAEGAVWRTSRTPEGAATLRVVANAREAVVMGQAWGPGAAWLLETLPALLGVDDDVSAFAALLDSVAGGHVVREAFKRNSGLRLGRTSRVFEALVPAVLEQKVVGREAWRAWRWLLRKYGEPAPGPAPEEMRVFPPPEVWRRIPSWDWHRAGAEAVRARTIINAALHADKLEATTGSAITGSAITGSAITGSAITGSAITGPNTTSSATGGSAATGSATGGSAATGSAMGVFDLDDLDDLDDSVTPGTAVSGPATGSAEADRLLRALPGIGVWTSAEIRQRSHGDPDAVSVGDYHIPGIVGWALTGKKTDDAGMLELLAPYQGQRYRVTRLLELGGHRPPARGPRMPARDYRSF